MFVVTLGLTVLSLHLLAEMTTAGLAPVKGVNSHKLAYLKEVSKTESFLEFLVETSLLAGNINIAPEVFLEFANELDTFLKTCLVTSHSDVLPHNVTESLVDCIDRLLTLD